MISLNRGYGTGKGYLFFLKGYLSQWYKIRMTDLNAEYNCAEQYMMAQKALLFGDHETHSLIMKTEDPSVQKDLGRQVKNFDEKKWNENCKLIVYKGNFLKFSQNLYLKKCLKETGTLYLVECNPTDKIWAIGMDDKNPDRFDPEKWNGKNFLGDILTSLRDQLKIMDEVCR